MSQVSHPSRWWKNVHEDTRTWLRENPGEAIPPDILQDITVFDVSELVAHPAGHIEDEEPTTLSEDSWDWIKGQD